MSFYNPVKDEGQNGMICTICLKNGKRMLVPSKRSNAKNPLDIDNYNLTIAKLHIENYHKKKLPVTRCIGDWRD